MALTVQDILELPSGQKMTLLAGSRGLDRPVISVEIADYEFAPGLEHLLQVDAGLEPVLESGSFIITSFLFAKDDPSLILSTVEKLEQMGMAGLAYKQVIYEDLPPEVLDFAEKKGFPIFSFGMTVWFENIIFDIMYAVQFDDRVYLAGDKLAAMVEGRMYRSQLDIIRKGISLKLQPYVSVAFVTGEGLDADRFLRSFYLQKGMQSKGLMARYEDGLFLIITSAKADQRSHELIRREIFEVVGIPGRSRGKKRILQGMSQVRKAEELDQAFRESWFCHLASAASGENFEHFGHAGVYRVVLPALEKEEAPAFAREILGPFAENPDLMETAREYVRAGGEITRVADRLHCHQNTVRYRLSRIRELTGLEEITESELYLRLKTAIAIDALSSGGDRTEE